MRSRAPSAMSSVGSAAQACRPCHDRLPVATSAGSEPCFQAVPTPSAAHSAASKRQIGRTSWNSCGCSSASMPGSSAAATTDAIRRRRPMIRFCKSSITLSGSSEVQARTWQKVVADEHAEQHEVVDDAFQVEVERQRRLSGLRPELQLEIVPDLADLRKRWKKTHLPSGTVCSYVRQPSELGLRRLASAADLNHEVLASADPRQDQARNRP